MPGEGELADVRGRPVASHLRWKMDDGRRFLVMMLRDGCDGFGDAAVCLGAGLGMEELAA